MEKTDTNREQKNILLAANLTSAFYINKLLHSKNDEQAVNEAEIKDEVFDVCREFVTRLDDVL